MAVISGALPSSSVALFIVFCIVCMCISSCYDFCPPRQRLSSCDCHKTRDDYELRCSAFTVRVKPKAVVHIQCNPNVVSDFSVLSGIRIGEVNTFVIRLCPLPSVSLSRLMQNISVSNVSNVQITSTGNLTTTVVREMFHGLNNVTSLTLHTDGTTQLTENVFTAMPNLTFIDLECNNAVFSKDVFQSVLKLQTLKLHSNNQAYLEPGIFRNLIHLRFLALCGNMLNLSRAVLSKINNLESLDINSNKITSLPSDLFVDLTKFRNINLYENEFTSLPYTLFRNNLYLETVNLQDNRQTLYTLPSRLLANLTKLEIVTIHNCNMSTLPKDLLWGSASVHTISLKNNAFTTLPESLFKDCKILRSLDISFNRITDLPKRLFSSVTNLMSLKINNNQLSIIPNQLFSTLVNLIVLDLKDNKLRQIGTVAFEMLSSLKTVNMSNNELTFDDTLRKGSEGLSPLKSCHMLEDVQLENNSLTKIFPDWRNLKNLETLNLAYNKISQIPFADLHFDSVTNTSVNVTYNNISTISIVRSETDFKFSSDDIVIKTRREIKCLPAVYIYIEGNLIKCDSKVFSAWNNQRLHGFQPQVKFIIDTNARNFECVKIDEYRNKLIEYVPLKFYTCLLKKGYSLNCPLQYSCIITLSGRALLLDCNQRNLTSMSKQQDVPHNLSRAVFTDAQSLEFLEIHATKILSSDLLLDLNKLEYINLYENEFLSLPQKLFVNNPNLKAINIEENRRTLHTLPPRFLSNLTNLTIVTIRNCKMSTLPQDLLWGSASIKYILLNNNAFTTLPELLFKDCLVLGVLDISYNRITDLPIRLFSTMNSLYELKIKNNHLSTITNDLFSSLWNLRVLDLEDNRLRYIEPQAFIILRHLRILYMSNNMLTFEDTSENGTMSPLRFCDALKDIQLANNSVTKIFSDWRKMKNLQTLNLAHNKISQIQAEDLDFILTKDIFVNISYNNISGIDIIEDKRVYKYVYETAVYNVPVRHFYIEGNPVNCDCKIYRFLQYKKQDVTAEIKLITKSNTSSLQCVDLEEYSGQMLQNIPITHFICLLKTEYMLNCPQHCSCILLPTAKQMFVECYGKNLTSLSSQENVLHNLSRHVFSDVHNLEYLDIKSNRMTVSPLDLFVDLINLRKLRMYANNFQSLPQNLFVNNTDLEVINIENNRQTLETLPPRLLANLTKLKEVRLNSCNISTLPEDLLWGSSSINTISLNNNAFTTLPEQLFMDCSELQTLDISFNRIADLPNKLFHYTGNLKTLKINNNELSVIKDYFFSFLKNLEVLDLKYNKLTKIEELAHDGLYSLKTVNMSNNVLTFENKLSPLLYIKGLEDIQLANNYVNKIFPDWRYLMELRTLDLAHNRISRLQAEDLQFYSRNYTFVNVSYNEISEIDVFEVERRYKYVTTYEPAPVIYISPLSHFSAEGNPINCGCKEYNLLRYYSDTAVGYVKLTIGTDPPILQRVKPEGCTEQLNPNIPVKYFTCLFKKDYSLNCPEECSCLFTSSDKALRVDCQRRNLTSVPGALPQMIFSKYIELNLSGNRIKSVKFPLGPGYSKVTKYILTDNMISEINLTAFSPKLQVLELDGNNINQFNNTSIEFLMNSTSLTNLTLHNNPWRCDCKTKDFVTVIQSIYNLRKIKLLDTVTCENGKKILQLNDTELCPVGSKIIVNENYIVAALGILSGLLIGLVLALYYKFQKVIKIWLYVHGCCLRFVTEDELDRDKLYDAFISYAHQDETFVMDHLVTRLENDQYKLCFHQRDWMPGEEILTNIIRSVEVSRRTIIVLSPAFLESMWSRMEFCAAHKQALNEGRVRVIVVMYEDIGPIDKLDSELRAYLTMNTYVKWGDQWFWDKLRYAMPHNLRTVPHGIPLQERA